MNLFTEQVSALGAVGVRQLDTQLQLQMQLLSSAAERAFDSAEQLAALQFATTRGALDTSAELLRQVVAARDPRDLFALSKHARAGFDSMLAYQRRLFSIASAGALSGSVVGLPRTVTPTASAALQKLASLPAVPVSIHAVVAEEAELIAFREVTEATAVAAPAPIEAAAVAAPAPIKAAAVAAPAPIEAAAVAAPAPIEAAAAVAAVPEAAAVLAEAAVPEAAAVSASEVIEAAPVVATSAVAPQEIGQAAVEAPTTDAPADVEAAPIAELTAVAAATGHHDARPSAAPVTAPEQVPAAPAAGKGRQRKK